ncbi:MAG TPA: right-handed parallel beta-helix repeat-containing protein, partial [Bacteroidetes bacterium]|nr:right-handed parallel beta-helix repeat-containing protein [Bacteroidota bacterium]
MSKRKFLSRSKSGKSSINNRTAKKMKKIIFFLIGIAFMIMLSINYSNGQNLEISCGTDEEVSGDIEERSGDCSTLFNGFLYNHLYDLVPTGTQKIKIKTNCVIVQDENGNGNFSLSNNQERDYLEKIFYYINENLENLYEENCGCQDNPTYYQDIKIEFEPTFFELKDPVLWDHNNDPNPQGHYYGSWHSGYLHEIYDKLKSTPGYTEGFDVYITNDGEDLNNYLNNNPDNLPCDQLDPPCESNYDGHWYSNYPTYNFDQGAFWHAPDLYIRYLQLLNHYAPWEIEDIDPKKVAYGFIHEYGHYFNLGHLFCSKNIMNPGNWNNRGSLDGCQVREMYKSLMTKNIRKFVICESGLDHKIEITNDEVWKLDARIYNDIVVKTGGSLKITCKLYMQPDTKIIVERGAKLFIDGGTITSQCNQWKGIVVQGNVNKEQPPVYQWPNEPDDAGVVLLTNDAVLENFYEGITDNNDYLGWPEMSEYWGGEVVCSNSSFLDGWRAVALMKYDYDDKSLFTGCDFNNLALGVTAWDREVLRFNNNTFKNVSRDAIVGENAEIEVEGGNTFENCGRGVWFLSSSPGDGYVHVGGKDLEPNVFNHNDYHVMTAGVIHPKGVEVKYCTMSNAAKNGIYIYGANKARDIGFNNIDGAVYGIKLQDAGQSWQNIRCNDIYNGFDADIAAYYNNNDATFKGNSLNDYRGLYVAGQSGNLGIIPDQLPNGAAPENCFGTSTQEVVTNDETRYFTYYTSADALPGDCRYIDNIFGNYSTEPSQSNYGLPCLDINWPDPPPYSEVDSAIIKMCELLEEQRLNPEDTLLEEEI